MNILNIIQCTGLGGMERANLLRIKGLVDRGHHVEVVSLNPLGALKPLLDEAGIPAIGLAYAGRYGWRSYPAMRRAFRRRPYEAIIMTGHNLAATLALQGLAAARKILCIHYHHYEDGRAGRHWPVFYRLALSRFDAITFCSDFIRDEAVRLQPRLQPKAVTLFDPYVMPDAVPSMATRQAARRQLGIAFDAPVVGNAGWLIPRKRFDVFVEVAAKISRTMPQAVFLIAGDGAELTALEERAGVLGIADQVRFLGWQRDMNVFYQALDVLLFNTDYDALPRTPIEATVHGVAVVASARNSGLSELLADGDQAIVLSEHDVDLLAKAVVDLLQDADRRAQMNAAARARIAAAGSLDRHADVMEALLHAPLRQKSE